MILASATAVAATVSTADAKASSPEEQNPQTSEDARTRAEAVPTASAVASALDMPEKEIMALPWPVHSAMTSVTASAMAEATSVTRLLIGTAAAPASPHATAARSTTACHACASGPPCVMPVTYPLACTHLCLAQSRSKPTQNRAIYPTKFANCINCPRFLPVARHSYISSYSYLHSYMADVGFKQFPLSDTWTQLRYRALYCCSNPLVATDKHMLPSSKICW